jgi:hypothetical protein
MIFGKGKEETPKSAIEQLLSAFTEQSVKMNAILGFPGVLLLMAIVFAALPAIPGFNSTTTFTILSATSLVGSVVTYLANWYYSLRHAQAQAQIVSDYTRLFVEKYLQSLNEVRAENLTFGIEKILMPLIEKRQAALPGQTESARQAGAGIGR